MNQHQVNLNQNDQINKLNSEVKCKLAASKIHGIGVFALMDISKGQKCGCFPSIQRQFFTIPMGSMSKLFPEIKELIFDRWASILHGSAFSHPNDDAWLILFMNHSDNPNYDIKTDTALRNIKKGEELTENYKIMKDYDKIYPWLKEDSKKDIKDIG